MYIYVQSSISLFGHLDLGPGRIGGISARLRLRQVYSNNQTFQTPNRMQNGRCYDTRTFLSYTAYTRLMPNTDGSVKLLHASLTSKKHREIQVTCMLYCLRYCLGFSETESHTHSTPKAIDSILKNMSVKTARSGQLQNYLQC